MGRKSECDFVEAHVSVSGLHCSFALRMDENGQAIVEVEDSSTNGTFLNGKKIGKGKLQNARIGGNIDLVAVKNASGELEWPCRFRIEECQVSHVTIPKMQTAAADTVNVDEVSSALCDVKAKLDHFACVVEGLCEKQRSLDVQFHDMILSLGKCQENAKEFQQQTIQISSGMQSLSEDVAFLKLKIEEDKANGQAVLIDRLEKYRDSIVKGINDTLIQPLLFRPLSSPSLFSLSSLHPNPPSPRSQITVGEEDFEVDMPLSVDIEDPSLNSIRKKRRRNNIDKTRVHAQDDEDEDNEDIAGILQINS